MFKLEIGISTTRTDLNLSEKQKLQLRYPLQIPPFQLFPYAWYVVIKRITEIKEQTYMGCFSASKFAVTDNKSPFFS
jgi:hypothetical protein